MTIRRQREIQIGASYQELCTRVSDWAADCGFVMETLGDEELVFKRGSSWHAIYTFDIAKLPTTVSIALSGEAPIKADCTYTVASRLSTSTPADEESVSEQFDLLVAYLNGTPH